MPDPSTSPTETVRFLVGDPAGATQLLSDAEIAFALSQTGDIPHAAAAMCARSLAARYAGDVDTQFETIESRYSQRRAGYEALARQLDQQAKRFGSLGLPQAGGVSLTEVAAVDALTDRVRPYFRDGHMTNPPAPNE